MFLTVLQIACFVLILGFPSDALLNGKEENQHVWAFGKESLQHHWLNQNGIHNGGVKAIPTTLRFQPKVHRAVTHLSVQCIDDFITSFTSYHNRYYNSSTGVEASKWPLNQVQTVIANSGNKYRANVKEFRHPWPQASVIAKIYGSNSSETIVLGAHLDSISDDPTNTAPGADDNASGSSTIFEAFKSILRSGIIPKRTLEFHWYAAEEVGMRGSQEIVEKYTSDGINVVGMVNFDMTGYVYNDTRICIMTYYTDPELNQFLRLVVDRYASVAWMDRAGGGASDFVSWTDGGYRSVSPQEIYPSRHAHSPGDVIQTIQFDRVLELAKVAIGFAVELGEPA